MPRQRLRAERGREPVLRPGPAAGPPGLDIDASHEREREPEPSTEGLGARVSAWGGGERVHPSLVSGQERVPSQLGGAKKLDQGY